MNNMHSHKKNIINCFDKSAQTYDENSIIQQWAGEKLIHFLKEYCIKNKIDTMGNVLDLGCGTGIVTEKFIYQLKYDNLIGLDISEKLLQQAKARLNSSNKSIVLPFDFDELDSKALNRIFECVYSNMSLHWSMDFKKIFSNIYHILNKKGVLAFSLPVDGTFSEMTSELRNEFYTEDNIRHFLSGAGFNSVDYFVENKILAYPSIIHAMKSIKFTGANYVMKEKHNAKQTYLYLKNRTSTPFFLNYNIGFFVAIKN